MTGIASSNKAPICGVEECSGLTCVCVVTASPKSTILTSVKVQTPMLPALKVSLKIFSKRSGAGLTFEAGTSVSVGYAVGVGVAVGELEGNDVFVGAGVSVVEGCSVGVGDAVGAIDGVAVGADSLLEGLVTPELTTTAAKAIDTSSKNIAVVIKNWFLDCAKNKTPENPSSLTSICLF